MVRNKRAAPTAPPPAAAPSPPLIQTLPWSSDRRKARAPLPPTTPTGTMPTSVEKAGGVLPAPTGQASTRFCLGPYERRGGGTTLDAADGGSLGVDSEGSSTDVGVCLDDSASDVSQESLVTSDSAVSSPPARRVGRLSPGASSTGSAAATPSGNPKDATEAKNALRSQPMNEEVMKTQTVSVNSSLPPKETNTTRVISVNSGSLKEASLGSSTVQVVSTSPAPPKAVSVVELNSQEISTAESSSTVVTSQTSFQVISVESKVTASQGVECSEAVQDEQNTSQTVSVSPTPPPAGSAKQNSPSPTASCASPQGSSSVFLSPEQPTDLDSSTAKKSALPLSVLSPSPSPAPSLAPPASATSQSSTSSVFLSPSQPDSESTSPQPAEELLSEGTLDEHQSAKYQVPQSPETPPGQQTQQKTKAPQPPRKSPAPQPPASLSSSSPAAPLSPGAPPAPASPRQSSTPASLRQLQAPAPAPPPPPPAIQTRTYAERQRRPRVSPMPPLSEHGFQFHLKEGAPEGPQGVTVDGFAGVRDYLAPTAPIHSSRGTVRGVKDRVRAGIATFLQDNSTAKALKSREQGRLVVYVTSMTIIRPTFQQCQRVRQILRQLMAEFEERDLFLSADHQQELRRRLGAERVVPPQLFIDGNLLGGAEAVERLNESGELRRMLKPFKMAGPRSSCGKCGGFRMLPCTACNGSKKSCHRNHFTEQWVVLRCGSCDQSGLMRCDLCRS